MFDVGGRGGEPAFFGFFSKWYFYFVSLGCFHFLFSFLLDSLWIQVHEMFCSPFRKPRFSQVFFFFTLLGIAFSITLRTRFLFPGPNSGRLPCALLVGFLITRGVASCVQLSCWCSLVTCPAGRGHRPHPPPLTHHTDMFYLLSTGGLPSAGGLSLPFFIAWTSPRFFLTWLDQPPIHYIPCPPPFFF